ncbi:hypothetical protein L3Y34_007528 [Caenorhabditis briggsae]|uniref:Uncharacterized protein n=1 Tax=Caenorhabditis briggsae TaxID=6238 RepID=A0AAE8ZX23_CAEBR|nr:hypothetical protein L3Y34_007528 [Caenorhabditis briggsae]
MTFKLMNIINCSQLVQSITHFLTGPGLIFPNIQKRYGLFVNIVGCTMNTFWIADFPMISLLAVSRILVFTNRIKTTRFPKPMKVLIFLSWSWIAFVLIYGCATQNLIFVSPGWDYDFSVPYAEFFSNLEITLSLSCLAISYTSYISIAFLIYKQKTIMSCVQSRKNETMILLQSTLVTGYITAMIFVWHQALFAMVSFIDMESKRNQGILNCCLMFHCYVNPTVTILCNKSVREIVLKIKQAVDDIIESVDDMSNPLYELLSNDFKSKEEFTVNDIAMMFKSLAETILKLQSQNTMLKNQNCILNGNLSNLTEKVDGLEENLKLLSSQPKGSPKPPTTLIKTFASAVASTISAPESQITFMRAASLANSEDARKSNVIIKNIDLSEEAIEKAGA